MSRLRAQEKKGSRGGGWLPRLFSGTRHQPGPGSGRNRWGPVPVLDAGPNTWGQQRLGKGWEARSCGRALICSVSPARRPPPTASPSQNLNCPGRPQGHTQRSRSPGWRCLQTFGLWPLGTSPPPRSPPFPGLHRIPSEGVPHLSCGL